MKNRFLSCWQSLNAFDSGELLWEHLSIDYQAPHRHYHTLQHIQECLEALDRYCATHPRKVELEAALWFHDWVYDPKAIDNEQQSSIRMGSAMEAAGISPAVIRRIQRHIESTAHHASDDADSALVIDIDLSILGSTPERFQEYEKQIRAEYAFVSETDFQIARDRIMRKFAERDPLFKNVSIQQALGQQAAVNLSRWVTKPDTKPMMGFRP